MIVRLLGFYQRWISPVLHSVTGAGGACRFQPTCSEYAAVAVERHGACRGLALAVWRLLRCNPLARGGFDPVPGKRYQDHHDQQDQQDPRGDFGTDHPRHLP